MKKRMIPILMLAILLFSLMPVAAAPNDYLIENGVLIRYSGTATDIVIPEGVTIIGEQAFFLKEIVSVTIPDSVTDIENGAFSTCWSLVKVTLSKNLKSIGDAAFYDCPKLKALHLPYGLERIGYQVFDACTGLTDITIPTTVSDIKSDSLPHNWTKAQKKEFIVLGDGILYKYMGKSENVIIPNNVKIICDSAFSYNYDSRIAVKSITVPGSVREIWMRAFDGYVNLTRVTLAEGVTSIHTTAFSDCPKLTQISIPKSLADTSLVSFREPWLNPQFEEFDIRGNGVLLKYKGTAAEVIIPDGVKYIAMNAFAGNHTLQTVLIPESVVSIGLAAFMNCTNLIKVNIPSGVKSIGEYAFYNCMNLSSIEIPRGVTRIEAGTFSRCMSLNQMDIPDTVTVIGEGAFASAYKLAEVTIPNSVKSIEQLAFNNCPALNGVIIPSGVAYIGRMAFGSNPLMTDIIIQSKDTRVYEAPLNENAFSRSTGITITAPAGGAVQRMAERNKILFKAN